MIALSKITFLKPEEVFENIHIIINACEKGSVITIDNAISVFAELCKAGQKYEDMVFKYILKHLETCRPKEVGQHSERAFICINNNNYKEFLDVLLKRKDSLMDTQKKRVDKLIKKNRKESVLQLTLHGSSCWKGNCYTGRGNNVVLNKALKVDTYGGYKSNI